uniref:Uncharacterized protein n=1 Tax=Tetranychus urticae TaxID=32264 RepID=T1KFH5_TETUR
MILARITLITLGLIIQTILLLIS